MAAGELTRRAGVSQADLPEGAVVTVSGRVSAAKMYEPDAAAGPFSAAQLARVDEALTLASREAGLDFSIYLGALGGDSRAEAERLFRSMGAQAKSAVLIAVSPGERVVEVVTGELAGHRLPQRSAKLAVMSMVASFKEGDLVGGLVGGLRMLSDQAGSTPG
ncbi:MAG: DUF5130 family protein [Actinophytocola sp.]|nr:DUF5130 family protein [Actinophytocola sp.]